MVEDKIAKEYERLVFDVKYDLTKIKDELASGLLLYRLSKEREASNAILSSVETKLNQIIALLEPSRVGQPRQELARALSEVDEKLITHIQRQGRADAEQIQQAFYVTGEVDFVLIVTAPHMEAFEALMSRLLQENANVKRYTTNVALGLVKRGLSIPVPLDEAE